MGSQSVPAGGTWHYQGPVWLMAGWGSYWHPAGEGQGAADTLRCIDRPKQATHQPQVPTVPKPWLMASCDLELPPHWLDQGQWAVLKFRRSHSQGCSL